MLGAKWEEGGRGELRSRFTSGMMEMVVVKSKERVDRVGFVGSI